MQTDTITFECCDTDVARPQPSRLVPLYGFVRCSHCKTSALSLHVVELSCKCGEYVVKACDTCWDMCITDADVKKMSKTS